MVNFIQASRGGCGGEGGENKDWIYAKRGEIKMVYEIAGCVPSLGVYKNRDSAEKAGGMEHVTGILQSAG